MTSQEILESDKKSHTPGPGYPSIKKDLRNKSNNIGQVSNARRFNDGRVDQVKFTAAIRQSEAVGKQSDQVIRSSIELISKVRNSNKFLG